MTEHGKKSVKKAHRAATVRRRAKQVAAGGSAAAAIYFGVGLEPATAKIIHKTTGFTVAGNSPITPWDVDGKGDPEFGFEPAGSTMYLNFNTTLTGGTVYNGYGFVRLAGDDSFELRNLPFGFSKVGTNSPPLPAGYALNSTPSITLFSSGNIYYARGFTDGVEGFAGFAFQDTGNLHFGWAKLVFNEGSNPSVEVLEWAYEDTPFEPIQVGAVPEPGAATGLTGLALLACGAAGVRRWKRDKKSRVA